MRNYEQLFNDLYDDEKPLTERLLAVQFLLEDFHYDYIPLDWKVSGALSSVINEARQLIKRIE
ncbi:hypothetical protein [Cytobacillus firmus]|uniref:hypothetical protein n=1 Tax=Cytobacillus firmus TaxID=1399 RepID=UPI0018CDA173|nr:hypothetical protein [Cytobacillus firmus]MBG9657104.1 hypothetical protein [Cytobacillus firmus]MED1906780.1 hypothetical protein [Cytobacillus firmus]